MCMCPTESGVSIEFGARQEGVEPPTNRIGTF
jgi:hypothetical protein